MTIPPSSERNGQNINKTVEVRTYDPAKAAFFCKTTERFGGLSNMAGGFPLRVNEINILTSEALYQACRFPHLPKVQRLIIEQRSPMTAKMKSKPYRDASRADWDSVRVRIMRWCLRVKLAQNWTTFGDLLCSTGDLPIVELSRKDDFWGAKPQEDGTLVGMNVLGRLLMELREQFKRATGEELKRVEPVPIANFLLFEKPIEIVRDCRGIVPNLTDPDLIPPNGSLWGQVEEPSSESNPKPQRFDPDHSAQVEEPSPVNSPTNNIELAEPNNYPASATPAAVESPIPFVRDEGAECLVESASSAAVKLPEPTILAEGDTCYSRCLPLLLQCLQREEAGEKQIAGIAKRLDVLPKQLKAWLERGISEGKVEKTRKKKKLVYMPLVAALSPDQATVPTEGLPNCTLTGLPTP